MTGELPEIIQRLLERRGIRPAAFDEFLTPSIHALAAPDRLDGVVEAADVILAAIGEKRRIVVFGDYDCDGVCATAILIKALQALDAAVEPFIPDRLSEGYGMSDASIARLLAEVPDVSLVITVDNGINAVGQIRALKERGISVVVTDHHLPGEELPPAEIVVNPRVKAPETLQTLCGAGVAFLLARQLYRRTFSSASASPGVSELLVLAGLATVTDIMPLLGQNRILVAEALARFARWAPLGLRELHARAARSGADHFTSRDFGFMLGPRINAAGRLADCMQALELILSDDREIARELARIVDGHNVERKAVEQKMTEQALAKIVAGASAQVIDLPDGHPGVAGIVAARVLERLDVSVPVCVIAGGHGSARAPEGLNLRDAFVACDEFLTSYGGHAAAGGFSVRPGCVDAFREKLCAYCLNLTGARPKPRANEPELWVEPADLTLDLATWLTRLEPFGEGNPEPIFGLRACLLSDVRPLGADGRHLSLAVRSAGLRAIWWGHGDRVEELRRASIEPHDLLFALIVSDYGERHVELRLVDVR